MSDLAVWAVFIGGFVLLTVGCVWLSRRLRPSSSEDHGASLAAKHAAIAEREHRKAVGLAAHEHGERAGY